MVDPRNPLPPWHPAAYGVTDPQTSKVIWPPCVVCGFENEEGGTEHRRCRDAMTRAERRGELRAAAADTLIEVDVYTYPDDLPADVVGGEG